MTTTHTTTRATITVRSNTQFEAMRQYGWRCGFYSMRPELSRHAMNADFLSGVRIGRTQRQSTCLSHAAQIILDLPRLVEMRRAVQTAYGDAAHRDKAIAAWRRSASRNDGVMSSSGRDIGAVQRARADEDAVGVWDQWHSLSAAYESERARLMALRAA